MDHELTTLIPSADGLHQLQLGLLPQGLGERGGVLCLLSFPSASEPFKILGISHQKGLRLLEDR